MYNETKSGLANLVGANNVGSSLSATVPKSLTERETELLHQAVSHANQLVGSLQTRLKPILKNDFPSDVSGESVEESIPALANAIRQSRYVVDTTISILKNTLDRLDM